MNVYYSNPYSVDKNFGGAINDFCKLIPNDNDWIVIQDGDITYLQPDWGVTVYNTIQNNKNIYNLLGCYTNRLRSVHQLHKGKFSNDHNILNHIEIAKEYKGYEVQPTLTIAGLFMAFSKETWRKVGGFKENDYTFDADFSTKVRKLGMKIGLMKGLYVYHQYRPWSSRPEDYIKHLK
jgi:GT2 family glycosyltransferase